VGADGKIRLRVSAPMHLIVDVMGLFDPIGSGSYRAVTPMRIRDDRMGSPFAPAGTAASFQAIAGADGVTGVPATARAVVLNVTAAEFTSATETFPSDSGFVQLAPSDQIDVRTSSVNFRRGADVANLAVVPIGPDGRIRITASIPVPLILDVLGWYE
jgi:hypothetical protein